MSAPPPSKSAGSRLPFILVVVGLVAAVVVGVAYFYPVSSPPVPQWEANAKDFKPVLGAFGWKLGDRLPDALTNEVSNGRYSFRPATNLPPFSQFELDVTDDARIYAVKATGYGPGSGMDPAACLKNLVSSFTRQYGLLHHQPDPAYLDLDIYVFGTLTKNAHLDIYQDNLFTLECVDQQLFAIHTAKLRAKPR